MTMEIIDLGLTSYRDIWDLQHKAQAEVIAGAPERIYLTEHRDVYPLASATLHIMARVSSSFIR